MIQNIPGLTVLNFSSKYNEILLRALHVEVRVLAISLKTHGPAYKVKRFNITRYV